MNITIENDALSVVISSAGAELQSIFGKHTLIEYLWQGDAAYWPKRSPVLFPIVGGLRNNQYEIGGQNYHLMRHGFARDQPFQVGATSADSVTFLLASTAASQQVYPFTFLLQLHYRLVGSQLQVRYQVSNTGQDDLPFSLGAHPAFNVPLTPGTSFTDYELVFEQAEPLRRWTLNDAGQLSGEQEAVPLHGRRLPLVPELFAKDALVFKHLQSQRLRLVSPLHGHGLEMHFPNWPYLGIWTKPGAPFLCLEPWCGIADAAQGPKDFWEKEGIMRLPAGESWERQWTLDFF